MKDTELNFIDIVPGDRYNFSESGGFDEQHLFKKLNKRREEKGKGKIGKKITDKIKKVAEKVGADDAVFLPLLPFKKAMKRRIEKAGVKPKSNKIKDIAQSFYDVVVKKTKGFEEQNIEPVTMTLIVSAIVSFFKAVNDKKKAGNASADEMEMAMDVEDGIEAAEDYDEDELKEETTGSGKGGSRKSTGEGSGSGGGELMDQKTIFMIIAALALIYFVSRNN